MALKKKNQNSIYNKLIGCLIKNGKKLVSEKIVFEVLEEVSSSSNIKIVNVIKFLVIRLGMSVELKTVRLRKNVFKVPIPVQSNRRNYLVIKNLLDIVNGNSSNQSIKVKLVQEILNIINNKNSKSLIVRSSIVKEAFKNKSNVHYRW
jgi:small subunit ribosomal protein S7